jgi:hypothetical protein
MKRLLLILSVLLFSYTFSFAQWDSLKGGINVKSLYEDAQVRAQIVYNGNLYVGGQFDTVDGMSASGLGRWNGVSWGVFSKIYGTAVLAFTIYNNNLVIGGDFDSVGGVYARGVTQWNGATWAPIGNLGWGLYGVWALTVYKGNLYAGGSFNYAESGKANNIAMWNGTTWTSVGSGLRGKSSLYLGVRALAVYNGNLYAGGYFDSAGNVAANNIAMWNGTTWSAVGAGLQDSGILALKVFDNELYVGGHFGSNVSYHTGIIDKWNGTTWSTVGTGLTGTTSGGDIYALGVYDSSVCATGYFDSIGGIAASNIAYWDGSKWGAMGSGLFIGGGYSVISYNSTLCVGGAFVDAGGIVANNIAQWSGPLAVNNISSSNDNIKVFPNPSNGVFQLRIKNYELGGAVKIYNMLGQEVASSNSSEGGEFKALPKGGLGWAIDISNQPSGIYLYRVTNSEGALVGSGKLVIN